MADYDLLLTNAHLATMAGDGFGAVRDGAIGIAGGRIAFAGPAAALPATAARETRDLGGRWVTPGLIDCHTHLVYAGNRAREFAMRLGGASYVEIAAAGGGIRSSVAATRAADEAALFAGAAERLPALLAEGVTTIEVKSGYGLDRDTELRMLRVARRLGESFPVDVVATYLGGHTLPADRAGDRAGYVALVEEVMAEAVEAGLADAFDAWYDPIGFDRAGCVRMADAATRLAISKYMQSVRADAPWCPSNIEFIRRINGLGSVEDVKRIAFGARYLVLGLGDVYLGAPVATPVDPRHRLVTTK